MLYSCEEATTEEMGSIEQKLSKFGIVESPLCTFCGTEDETLEHLFVLCHHSKVFWRENSNWLQLGNIHTAIDLTNPVNIIYVRLP